ncbi:Protein Smaug like protein 1 [Myotis brandtii]|uniref:Protein Smaug like protein 1 n=1 Tax=Myotis brandtii TaxID=109478 RepID=S7N5D5_MYOBR|nr:Protein Smaug like protein 1 [Myotis brandtii]
MGRRNPRQYQIPSRNVPSARLGLLGTSGFVSSTQRNTTANPTIMKQGRQNLWFANPGGSNSMPSRTHSSVQRTRSLPVHTSPQNMLMFQQPEFQLPVTEPDINNRLESLCLSMTEHALGGECPPGVSRARESHRPHAVYTLAVIWGDGKSTRRGRQGTGKRGASGATGLSSSHPTPTGPRARSSSFFGR